MKMTPFKTWMGLATGPEQQGLADAVCRGSRAYLYHWSNGKREPDAATAAEIERYTSKLNRLTGGRLPVVPRVSMVAACAACEFAQRCMPQQQPLEN